MPSRVCIKMQEFSHFSRVLFFLSFLDFLGYLYKKYSYPYCDVLISDDLRSNAVTVQEIHPVCRTCCISSDCSGPWHLYGDSSGSRSVVPNDLRAETVARWVFREPCFANGRDMMGHVYMNPTSCVRLWQKTGFGPKSVPVSGQAVWVCNYVPVRIHYINGIILRQYAHVKTVMHRHTESLHYTCT